MTSAWPTTLDAFPGVPYTDNVQYIIAAFANAWVAAINQLQNKIGYGTGNNAANPLYSVAFATNYPTITARLNAVEVSAAGQLVLDANINDILPVSSTAAIGNSGKSADARHQHVGVHSFMGRTGDVTTTATDIGAIFQHKGDLIAGTGPGTGEIFPGPPAGSGYTLISGGGPDPSGLQWQQAVWQPGDVKMSMAINPPIGWTIADGHAVSRATFANLLAASTIATTASLSIGSATVSGLTTTVIAQLWVGIPVEGPGIPAGTTVIAVGSSSVTLSNNVGSPGGSQTVTFFPYGQGDGATQAFGSATTFNVVDLRGATAIGAGQAPGRTNRIMGAPVAGVESVTLSVGQLPFHRHLFSDPGHQHASNLATGTENQNHAHLTINGFGYQIMVGYPWSTVNFEWGPPGSDRIPITVTPAEQPPGTVPAEAWGSVPENPMTSFEYQPHVHFLTDSVVAAGLSINNAIDNSGAQAQGSPVSTMQPSVVVRYLVYTG